MPPNPTSPPRKPGRLFDPKSPLRHITMGRKETFRIHPGDIHVRPGFNARTEFTGIEDLAASLFHHGQELPVTVRPTGVEDRPVELINGERRWRAAKHIVEQWDPEWCLDCKIKPKSVKSLDLLLSQLIANEGVPFTFLEKARLTRRILNEDPDLKPADIARHTGESKQAVSDQLTLVDHAAERIIEVVASGRIAATTAVKIVRRTPNSPDDQISLLDAALERAAAEGRQAIKPRDLETVSSHPEDPDAPPWTEPENGPPIEKSAPEPAGTEAHPNPESWQPGDPAPEPEPEQQQNPDDEADALITDHSALGTSSPDPGAVARIKSAPSTNRDGTAVGPGNDGGFISPDKRLKQLNALLEKVSEGPNRTNPDRVTTAELVLGYIENTVSNERLREHLTGCSAPSAE